MSTTIKSIGYYYPLPELKSDEDAYRYFKQFFKDEFEEVENGRNSDLEEFSYWGILMETIEILNQGNWLPFCDIKGNWAWIKYIHDEEECDDTDIVLGFSDIYDNYIELTDIISKADSISEMKYPRINMRFFAIDWYNGSDFPLIIR